MKCPKCGGSGKVFCSMCKGTGLYHEDDLITEQEYIQTCTTEQLAEEISQLVFGGDFKKHISKMGYINMHSFKTEIAEWLKQPHTP
jgi:DnaJ-class molecular chaperone